MFLGRIGLKSDECQHKKILESEAQLEAELPPAGYGREHGHSFGFSAQGTIVKEIETRNEKQAQNKDLSLAQTKVVSLAVTVYQPHIEMEDQRSKELKGKGPPKESCAGAMDSGKQVDASVEDTNNDLGMELLGLEEGQKWERILSDKHLLPKILVFLQPKTILNLRLVSNGINNAVGQIFQLCYLTPQQTFNWGTIPHATTLQRKIDFIQRKFDFSTMEKIVGFGSLMKPQEYAKSSRTDGVPNPFLSRFIVLYLDLAAKEYDINETLLSLFGVHLWTLKFCAREPISEFTLGRFVLALNYVENLKTLSIRGSVSSSQDWSSSILPKLEYLKCLDVSNFHILSPTDTKFDESITMALIRTYGKQLENFYCNGEFLDCPKISNEMLQDLLPNVKHLCVSEFTEVSLDKLSHLQNWKLKLLQLSGNERNWNFEDFVPVLTTFSKSLTELHLLVPLRNDPNHRYPQLSLLRNLRKLSVEIMSLRGRWFWNTLLPVCVGLEELNFDTVEEASPNTFGIKPYTARARAKDAFRQRRKLKLEKVRIWLSSSRNIVITRAEVLRHN